MPTSLLETTGIKTVLELLESANWLTFRSSSELTLFPVHKAGSGPLEYVCDPNNTIRIPGAHGEEIVRDIITDVQVWEF